MERKTPARAAGVAPHPVDRAVPRPVQAAPVATQRKVPTLPPSVTTPTDANRLLRELVQLDDALLQLKLRSAGESVKMPKTSRTMDLITDHNKLNLLNDADRKHLRRFLELIVARAPCLHFSFSSDPSTIFMEKLMTWLRHEIHPHVLVTVGLQPTIGAGCVVRSTNRYFDFSFKQTFADQRPRLLKELFVSDKATQ